MDDRRYSTAKLIGWFWRGYVRRTLPLLVLGAIFMSIEGGALGALSYMVRPMFDDVLVAGDASKITFVGLVVFGIFLGRAAAGFLQKVAMGGAVRHVSTRLQTDLVTHLLRLDSAFFVRNSPGRLMERVIGDTNGALSVISTSLATIGRDVAAVVSLVGVAISIDLTWTVIALGALPLIVFPLVLLQRFIRNVTRLVRVLASNISNRLDEIFHGIDTIKLNAIEDMELRRFRSLVRDHASAQLKTVAATASVPALLDVVAAIGFLGVLTYGGHQIIAGEQTVGDFMAFFTAIGLLFDPIRRIGALAGTVQRIHVSLERLRGLFDEQPSIASPAQPRPMPENPGQLPLTLENVTFAYGDQPVLKDVSLTAEPGKTTALVGASGAGKTTIFKLLTRLIDPDEGAVKLGGTDIREFGLPPLRDLFSVVTQDTQLFDEPVRRNIDLRQIGDEAALNAALEAAHVADFLPALPEGLDSTAGPRGSALSGGQRQRVAIARALLRNTPFLLLDEATSALDTQSEAIVQAALNNLSAGRTTLVIAHRLSTIRNADKIIVMDQGRVVDQGTHDELIAREGIYAGLYHLQFRGA